MPAYSEVIRLFRQSTQLPGFTLNGAPITTVAFRVKRPKRGLRKNIKGRPGLTVEMLANGEAIPRNAKVKGTLSPGKVVVTVGDEAHQLAQPLEFGGGDKDVIDYWFSSTSAQSFDVEVVNTPTIREDIRLLAALEVTDAYVISAPNETKGRKSPKPLPSGPILFSPPWFVDSFDPKRRTGTKTAASTLADTETRETIGVYVGALTPIVANLVDIGWSDSANAFFTDSALREGVKIFSRGGYTLPAGAGVAVFDDELGNNWADDTPVTVSLVSEQQTWARMLDETITDRLVETEGAADVQTVATAQFEIAEATPPAGIDSLADRYGRVWTVIGTEALGGGRWNLEATRVAAESE